MVITMNEINLGDVIYSTNHYVVMIGAENNYAVINRKTGIKEYSEPRLAYCLEWAKINDEFVSAFFRQPVTLDSAVAVDKPDLG